MRPTRRPPPTPPCPRWWAGLGLALVVALSPPAHGAPARADARLTNGLRVVMAPGGRGALVHVGVMVKGAGSLSDPPGRPGVAALTVEGLRGSTVTRSSRELQEQLDGLGARLEASVDWDRSVLRLVVLSRNAPAALELMGEVLLRPAFRVEDLTRARSRLGARSAASLAEPTALATSALGLLLFGPQPAGWPPPGTERSISVVTRDEVAAFHAQRYRADAVVVGVSGEFKSEDMVAVLERSFGTLRAGGPPPAPPPPQPWPRRARLLLVDKADAAEVGIAVGQLGVEREHPLYVPGMVATEILAGPLSSRTVTALSARGLSASVRGALDARRSAGTWVVTAGCRADAATDVLGVLLAEVERLQAVPASRREVDEAVALLAGQANLGADSPEAAVLSLLDQELHGGSADPLSRVTGTSPRDVARAAQALVDPALLRIVVEGPASVLEKPLQRWGPVEVRSARDWSVEAPEASGPSPGGAR